MRKVVLPIAAAVLGGLLVYLVKDPLLAAFIGIPLIILIKLTHDVWLNYRQKMHPDV